jgi:hypothetical protein
MPTLFALADAVAARRACLAILVIRGGATLSSIGIAECGFSA